MDLTDEQDRCLAERAAAGDDEAFAALVDRHREALVRFVARRTGGRTTIAEDAVQDALVSALHALRGADPPRDVKAWLHTVAWRRAVDLLRREAPPAGAWEDLRTVEGIDVAVADAWELDRMLGHWARLPRRQRHALAMRVLEGRSLEEIGELGVSPGAAKSLVARSRRSLAVAVASGEPQLHPPRRRRHLLFLPPALVERLREAATFAVQHEQPASLVTKACAGACAAVLAGGASTAVVAVAPVQPLVKPAAEHAAAAEKRKPRRPAAPRARPAPTTAPVPAATATPATGGAAAASPTPNPQTATAVTEHDRRRATSRRPSPYPAGGETFTPSPEPTATPTPAPTAEPEATAAPTAEPAG